MVEEHGTNSKTTSSIDFVEKKLDFFVKNTILSLSIIGFLALVLRLYYFPFGIPVTLDALNYFWYAMDISLLGHFPASTLANNGWPTFLSIFFSSFHFNNFMDYMILQRIVTVSISVLTIVPVYLLCNRFFDKPYAIIGAAIFAFEPRIIQNSLLGITEPLYVFLGATALFLFLSSNKKMVYSSFGICALLTLVRPEGLFLFFALSIMFLIQYRKQSKFIAKYALAATIFVLLLLPLITIRIQIMGDDSITSRISETISYHVLLPSDKTNGNSGLPFVISGIENLVKFLGWASIPIFVVFVPFGAYLILKNRNHETNTILVTIGIMLIPAVYAFSIISDTRYLFFQYPMWCVLSLFTVKTVADKFRKRNIVLILLIGGILLSSSLFLDFKKVDMEHEKEALSLSYYVTNTTSGINPYLPESKYLPMPQMIDQKFPILSTSIQAGPKLISTDGFDSLEEYIKFGRDAGLTHLVLDGTDKFYRTHFFKDVFFNEEKYPYLTKEFDSWDHGYKYHLKIYKIDYDEFYSIIKHD